MSSNFHNRWSIFQNATKDPCSHSSQNIESTPYWYVISGHVLVHMVHSNAICCNVHEARSRPHLWAFNGCNIFMNIDTHLRDCARLVSPKAPGWRLNIWLIIFALSFYLFSFLFFFLFSRWHRRNNHRPRLRPGQWHADHRYGNHPDVPLWSILLRWPVR